MNRDDLPPRGAEPRNRVALTETQLEELLATTLEGDDTPHQPLRRNLMEKLNTLRHQQERRDEINRMTPQQIVDSIPRHG